MGEALEKNDSRKIQISRYYNEPEEFHLNIFTRQNDEGTIAATIGLMEYDQSQKPETQIYSEVPMDVRGSSEVSGNIISNIDFCVLKDGWKVGTEEIFENMVSM